MFIKKDLRKIPEILEDEEDDREVMRLSKRSAEFKGSLQVLRLSLYSNSSLSKLRVLNLYDNHINTLEGIGNLDITPIEEINLGCNELNHLPFEFGRLVSLRSLWLDDNNFEEFPTAICQLCGLESLRFSGNKLSVIPPTISRLTKLETLALDNNLFVDFPEPVTTLINLKYLWMRQNKLTEVPESIAELEDLEVLSLSSNEIKNLPALIPPSVAAEGESYAERSYLNQLQKVYLNGNKLNEVPDQWAQLPQLKTVNLANNVLYAVPVTWNSIFSDRSADFVKSGLFSINSSSHNIEVYLRGNPVLC